MWILFLFGYLVSILVITYKQNAVQMYATLLHPEYYNITIISKLQETPQNCKFSEHISSANGAYVLVVRTPAKCGRM